MLGAFTKLGISSKNRTIYQAHPIRARRWMFSFDCSFYPIVQTLIVPYILSFFERQFHFGIYIGVHFCIIVFIYILIDIWNTMWLELAKFACNKCSRALLAKHQFILKVYFFTLTMQAKCPDTFQRFFNKIFRYSHSFFSKTIRLWVFWARCY